MNLLDSLAGLLGGNSPGAAQDRYTHAPIVYSQPHDPSWLGQYGRPFWQVGMTTTGRTGMNPLSSQPTIEIQSDTPGQPPKPDTLKHEIVHSITQSYLPKDSVMAKRITQLIPSKVRDQIDGWYHGDIATDNMSPEYVANFLTADEFMDPEYNSIKRAVVSAFPGEAKGKLIRLLTNPSGTTPGQNYPPGWKEYLPLQ